MDGESTHESEWLTPPAPATEPDGVEPAAAAQPARGGLRAAGLVAAGLVLGGAVALAVGHADASSPTTAIRNAGNGGPLGQQGPLGQTPLGQQRAGAPPGGFGDGGRDGEQRISGTLTAVGSSTVTVTTVSGKATYSVTSESQIVRNGSVVALSALKVGDPVFLHVYQGTSDNALLVERIFAGTQPGRGGFGGPPPGAPGSTGTNT